MYDSILLVATTPSFLVEYLCKTKNDKTTSKLSDAISTDLKRRGMKFIGSTIIYAYLQAVGIINSHDDGCYKHAKKAS